MPDEEFAAVSDEVFKVLRSLLEAIASGDERRTASLFAAEAAKDGIAWAGGRNRYSFDDIRAVSRTGESVEVYVRYGVLSEGDETTKSDEAVFAFAKGADGAWRAVGIRTSGVRSETPHPFAAGVRIDWDGYLRSTRQTTESLRRAFAALDAGDEQRFAAEFLPQAAEDDLFFVRGPERYRLRKIEATQKARDEFHVTFLCEVRSETASGSATETRVRTAMFARDAEGRWKLRSID